VVPRGGWARRCKAGGHRGSQCGVGVEHADLPEKGGDYRHCADALATWICPNTRVFAGHTASRGRPECAPAQAGCDTSNPQAIGGSYTTSSVYSPLTH
jgi:hypothetical protein